MTDSFFEGIDDRIDAKAEETEASRNASDWDPSPGEQLNGILLKTRVVKTKYGPAVVLVVRNVGLTSGGIEPEESCNIWCSRTTLIGGLMTESPKVGKGLAIRFDGQADTQDGSGQYYAYTVVAEEEDRHLWDNIEVELDTTARLRKKKAQRDDDDDTTDYF